MKSKIILLVFLLILNFTADAKTQSKFASKKTTVYLTVQAENGSIKQKFNEDGTITCTIEPEDVIRVLTIYLNGEDVTYMLENNKITLPLLTKNVALEVVFDSPSADIKTVYNTITMF